MDEPLRVALDVGPLHGHRTGVGHAVGALHDALAARADLALLPYVISARARLVDGERRMPIPAAVAHRLWARGGWPRFDRWVGAADVVHGTNYVVPPSRLPRVVSVYDCWFLAHPELAHPVVSRAGYVLRRAAGDGAFVHTSSRASADAVARLLDTDRVVTVHLAPLGVSPPPVRAPIAGLPAAAFVVAIGTQERRKNLPRLVSAFGRAVAEGLDARLVIAGAPGDDAVAIAASINRLRAEARRRVVHLGRVGDSTKWWLLHHASALAYVSLDEGFGFPILEAQQIGLPVVGGTAGSIPEVGGEGVELVEPTDVGSIAGGLMRTIDDDDHRARLIARGTTNVARFSWDATAEGLASLYRRAVVEHPR